MIISDVLNILVGQPELQIQFVKFDKINLTQNDYRANKEIADLMNPEGKVVVLETTRMEEVFLIRLNKGEPHRLEERILDCEVLNLDLENKLMMAIWIDET